MMADFAFRLSFVAEEQAEIRHTLLHLLHDVFEQIESISPDNPWLQQQLAALVQATQPPLSARRLDDVQRRLKALVIKQVEAREQTLEAQRVMKETLAVFLERLAQTVANSDQARTRFESCAERLEQAGSLADMAPVLQEAIQSPGPWRWTAGRLLRNSPPCRSGQRKPRRKCSGCSRSSTA